MGWKVSEEVYKQEEEMSRSIRERLPYVGRVEHNEDR